MKKKLLLTVLTAALALSLTACGNSKELNVDVADKFEDSDKKDDASDADDKEEASDAGEAKADVPASDVGKYLIDTYETADGTKVDHDTLVTAGMGETYLELKDDGTGTLFLYDKAQDVTWKKGEVKIFDTTVYTYELDGDKMKLDMQGVIYNMIKEGGDASSDSSSSDDASDEGAAAPAGEAPQGDGIVSEEMVQKGYVWMNKVNPDIFNATYEDIAAYFGTDGKFDKEEYSDHMEQNRRYYFWISEDDDTHFVYVNFGEKDPEGAPGVYKVTGFNSSGFSSTDAEAAYLEELQAQ